MDQNENDKQNQSQDQNGTPGSGPDKTEKTVPYERFQAVNAAKKAAEETLTGLVTELVEDIPEQYRALVPNIAPADQIKWIREAQKSGLFSTKKEPSGPDSKRPGGKPPVDFSNMSATQRMAAGYEK